ncbi:MAG: hypothetical protein M2R45_03258 [Verrucomicrobia subdivision 3 bacterium]|nr:hypothetical protein [Limisphaerales bacterium]MCS1416119.1 hypothetical protein [Limisphaerales bacterium]
MRRHSDRVLPSAKDLILDPPGEGSLERMTSIWIEGSFVGGVVSRVTLRCFRQPETTIASKTTVRCRSIFFFLLTSDNLHLLPDTVAHPG